MFGQAEQFGQLRFVEGRFFAGPLDFDVLPAAGHDDIHIDLGIDIFLVIEIKHRRAVDDADTHGGNALKEHRPRGIELRGDRAQGILQRDVGAGDTRRARAAVGIEHFAIADDRSLAERIKIDNRPEGAADEPLNLGRAAIDLAVAFALFARARAARKHVVLGGEPALAAARHPVGNFVLDTRRAENTGPAELNKDAARRSAGKAAGEANVAKLIGTALIVAHGWKY